MAMETSTGNGRKKPAKRDNGLPDGSGLTKAHARRFLELLRTAEHDYEPSSYLRSRLKSAAPEDRSRHEALMHLWAARAGYPYCLRDMTFAAHYSDEEQLYLLETGRDKMHLPDDDDGRVLNFARYYGAFFVRNMSVLGAIVDAHERAVDWQASRIRAFRLMAWLAMPDGVALQLHERLGLVAALAKEHVCNAGGDPSATLPYFQESAFLVRNGGELWRARDLALAIGTTKMWIDALMKLEDENGSSTTHYLYRTACRFARIRDVFATMTMDDVERFLPDYDANGMPDDFLAFDTFFRERNLTPAEILRIAKSLRDDRASDGKRRATPSRLVDVLCLIAGPQLPAVDELLSFSLVDDEWAKRYIAFFVQMAPDRRKKLLERDLENPESNGGGLLIIAADPTLANWADRYKTKHVCAAFANNGATTEPDIFDRNATATLEGQFAPLADDRVADSTMFAREALMVLVRYPATHPRAQALRQLVAAKLGTAVLDPASWNR